MVFCLTFQDAGKAADAAIRLGVTVNSAATSYPRVGRRPGYYQIGADTLVVRTTRKTIMRLLPPYLTRGMVITRMKEPKTEATR